MKENTIPEISNIINEATTPVLILVVADNCNVSKPTIQDTLEKKILDNNRPVALFTVCMPEESLVFPRPEAPELYYYLPKNQTPIFWRGIDMVANVVDDIEVAEKMMIGVGHDEARYSDEQKKQIAETEAGFEQESAKEFPPKMQQARNFVKELWKTAKRGMTSLPIITTAEEGSRRLTICEACPSFEESSSRCKECGCSMIVKTQLAGSVCPLKKW